MAAIDSWSTQQITVLLASISTTSDRVSAMSTALEFAVASVDAEVGVVLDGDDQILTSLGFRRGEEPADQLVEVAHGRRRELDITGVAVAHTLTIPLGTDEPGVVIIGRCSSPLSNEEKSLLRGMVRVLALTLRSLNTLHRERALRQVSEAQAEENARLLRSLQERQELLESLAGIQKMITSRAPFEQVMRAIFSSAAEHIGAEMALLVMTEGDDATRGRIDALCAETVPRWSQWRGLSNEVVQLSLEQNRPVVDNNFDFKQRTSDTGHWGTVNKIMSVPIQENGVIAGALIVLRKADAPPFTDADAETLRTFGEHISIVVTDASTANEVHRALQDPLTSLPNRLLFLQHVEQAVAAASRPSTVGVLFIDLDGFKRVNDTLGHAAGDVVLAAAAERLRNCGRGSDIVGRIGGDEFSYLAKSFAGSEKTLMMLAERIVHALRQPFQLYGREIFIGASVGIALNRSGFDDAEDLLRRADVAMYQAKAAKAGCLVFRDEMQDQLMKSLEIEAELRTSLESGGLELAYQPVVGFDTGAVIGFEALIRWNHPTLGRLTPDAFIPQAEESGLIRSVDKWVLAEACRQAGEWKRQCGIETNMSINVSGLGIVQPDFVNDIVTAVQSNGISPSSLILELTETVLVKDIDAVAQRLQEVRATGVRLAIDDFGTGFSSLTHLHRFPFNMIKVDRTFVAGLGTDERKSGLVRAVLRLGAELGLEVIAEGVETAAQFRELAEAGCHLGQGFLFDRPLSVADATRAVADTERQYSTAQLG